MQQIVGANHLRIRVREDRKRISHLLREASADFRRINADRGDAQAFGIKIIQPLLETPQLGVAQKSPITAIKNEHRAFGLRARQQLAEAHWFAVLVGKGEVGRPLRYVRCGL